MTWFLKYSTKSGEKTILRIEQGMTIRIGRGSASDTKIDDTAMSRVHCEIVMNDSTPMLQDLGSSTGTFLGRKKITDCMMLNPGQTFQAGNTRFEVVSDSPLDAPTRLIGTKPLENDLVSLAEQLLAQKTLTDIRSKR